MHGVFSELDLGRIDQAARVLALKRGAPAAEALIAAASVELARSVPSAGNVLAAVAALIRGSAGRLSLADHPDAPDDELEARARGLLFALDEPADRALLRSLLRGGAAERRPGLAALRRLRRALKRFAPAAASPAEAAPLHVDALAWDELLDGLARSLAVEREAEVLIDVGLDEEEPATLAARRAAIRAMLQPPAEPVGNDPNGATWAPHIDGLQRTLGPGRPGERAPFEAGHTIGRFTVLHRLGAGAMGVVYAAYDPELDRKIALKVLRLRSGPRSTRGAARLLREAQAMARLAHPNVAVVHEVGTHQGDVFVAMEFIRGLTLQTWLLEQKPGWREAVAVFTQAGLGLAAAHAAGLVHRDFKPANAMLGADGRVRVLDFGLCYTSEASDEVPGERPPEPDPRLTRGEEIVGTPAYMPPEQFSRGAVGPASDQFSFCASLYEALYRQLPFAGDTAISIALAATRGELQAPPRAIRVPTWLHALVCRGLKPDPKDRFASMDELLRALDRGRGRGRTTAVAALVLAVAAGVGGYALAPAARAVDDPCSGGAREIGVVWSDDRRRATGAALGALGPAFSQDVWPQVEVTLDRYAARWQGSHRGACEAHRRGEHSGALLDRRMACLAQRRVALDEAITVLASADAEVGLRALEIAGRLPELERCADVPALEAAVPPPAAPAVRAATEALTPKLERAHTLERAGQQTAALALADAVVAEAEHIGDAPTLAHALLERARLSIHLFSDWDALDALISRAYLTALGARDDESAAEALTLRLYHRGTAPGQLPRARDDVEVARELVQRLPSPARLRGLFLNNASAVRLAAGDPAGAEALLREALAVREAALGAGHSDTALTLTNLAMVVRDEAEREQLMRRALTITKAELGPAHPQTNELRIAAAARTADPQVGVAMLRDGCAALERFAPEHLSQRATCLSHLGEHAEEAGDPLTASAARQQSAVLVARLPADDAGLHPAERALIRGHAATDPATRAAAITDLRARLAELSVDDEWWQRDLRAEVELCLGLLLAADADPSAARIALTSATRQLDVAARTATDVISPRRLNRARVALAGTLLAGAGAREQAAISEAAALLDAAEHWYIAAGTAFAWRRAEITALRASAGLEVPG